MPFNYVPANTGDAEQPLPQVEPRWLSDAAIYQWDDEFGDVGEPNPALEEELFEGVDVQRAGDAIKALAYDVITEGPEKVHPVRDVSYASCMTCLSAY